MLIRYIPMDFPFLMLICVILMKYLEELFQKIYIYFIQSEDYVNSMEKLDDEKIKKQAERLRAEAKEMLFSNKIWGGAVGIIPGIDWVLQKFVIKKNAAKKLG